MSTVTERISEIKQPYGGYLKPSQFIETVFNDGNVLVVENVPPNLIGMAVDYLTRFILGAPIEDAFEYSKEGYNRKLGLVGNTISEDKRNGLDIDSLLNAINGLDDISIISACKAVTYDDWFRNPFSAFFAKGPNEINPDKGTINNIRVMVERSITFWGHYGPIVKQNFTFEEKGYTKTVDSGDGDYLTVDTLWDFKVSKSKPASKHTLQVLMYWIMGLHSEKPEFKTINKLGFFNPRLNAVFLLETKDIPEETIRTVEKEVICYKNKPQKKNIR